MRRFSESPTEQHRLERFVFPQRGMAPRFPEKNGPAVARQWLRGKLPWTKAFYAELWSDEIVMGLYKAQVVPSFKSDILRQLSFASTSAGSRVSDSVPPPAQDRVRQKVGVKKRKESKPTSEELSSPAQYSKDALQKVIRSMVQNNSITRTSADQLIKKLEKEMS